MMCPDCGRLRHAGECAPIICRECGEPLDGDRTADGRLCEECADFLAERDSRAAMAWYEIMEEQNHERAH